MLDFIVASYHQMWPDIRASGNARRDASTDANMRNGCSLSCNGCVCRRHPVQLHSDRLIAQGKIALEEGQRTGHMSATRFIVRQIAGALGACVMV
jgi:hypothetical protein